MSKHREKKWISDFKKMGKNWCPISSGRRPILKKKWENPKKNSGNSGPTPEAPALDAHPSLREHGRELALAYMIRTHLETCACHDWLEFSTDNSEIGPQIRDWIYVQFNFFLFWPFSFLPLQSTLFPRLCVRLFKFVYLFVVINPKVSRSGLEVKPLLHPLGPRSSSCGQRYTTTQK